MSHTVAPLDRQDAHNCAADKGKAIELTESLPIASGGSACEPMAINTDVQAQFRILTGVRNICICD